MSTLRAFALRRLTPPAQGRYLVAWWVIGVTSLITFYIMFTAVPHVMSRAGEPPALAGAATAVLVGGAVLGELAAPALVARQGILKTSAWALVVMAASCTPQLSATSALALGSAALRGVGFGVVMVTLYVGVARHTTRDELGTALGITGLLAAIAPTAALPLGSLGTSLVMWVAAATAALGLAGIWTLRAITDTLGEPRARPRVSLILQAPRRMRSLLAFGVAAGSAGILMTYLPTSGLLPDGFVAVALVAYSGSAAAGRLLAGIAGDHRRLDRLMPAALAATAGGVALVAIHPSAAAGVVAVAVVGGGFGSMQSLSLHALLRESSTDVTAVSAVWNLTYDVGLGAGPLLLGFLLMRASTAAGFLGVSAFCLLAAIIYVVTDKMPRREKAI